MGEGGRSWLPAVGHGLPKRVPGVWANLLQVLQPHPEGVGSSAYEGAVWPKEDAVARSQGAVPLAEVGLVLALSRVRGHIVS